MTKNKNISIFLLLTIGFICNPLFDSISVILNSGAVEASRISLITRGLFSALVFLSAIVLNFGKKNKIATLLICILPISSCIVWMTFGLYDSQTFLENTIYTIKAASFFSFLYVLNKLTEKEFSALELTIKTTLLIYLLCIVVGAFLDISAFRSYSLAERSGYKGIIIAQNEAAGLILAAALIPALRLVQRKSKNIDIIVFILAVISSFLLGAKASILGIVLSVAALCICRYGALRAIPAIILSLIVLFSTALLAYTFITEVNLAVQSSISYFEYQYDHYANGNIITLLLSGRDNKLDYVLNSVIPQNYFYILFGGYPMGDYSIEVDFPDLVLLMGFPIAVIYILQLIKAFTSARDKTINLYSYFCLGIILIIANTAGHIFVSALVLPYISFLCAQLRRSAIDLPRQYRNMDCYR